METEKTAQQTYTDALNFVVDENDPSTTMATASSTTNNLNSNNDKIQNENKMLKRILSNFNDKSYLYPGISIIVMLILVILILFQYIGIGYKFLSVVIFIAWVMFTVCVYKQQV